MLRQPAGKGGDAGQAEGRHRSGGDEDHRMGFARCCHFVCLLAQLVWRLTHATTVPGTRETKSYNCLQIAANMGAAIESGAMKPWYLYLIECRDGSVYTGIAIDVAGRYAPIARGRGRAIPVRTRR